MKDPEPWVKTGGTRTRFPCLTATYQPRSDEQIIRDEIEEREAR